ncbi:MAG TPA: hypothetical protein VJH03_26620 [Blastocatellia bacterium]|nr:hypothetical protein [Blastocatellia bacterium]
MKALISIAFLAASVAGSSFQARAPELRLTLQLEETQYSAGEPIIARVLIENLSPTDVVINRRLLVNRPIGPHEIFFQITGPDGKLVPFEARIRESFESREFMTLETKQIFGRLYNLARSHTFETPGEYTVTAFYENKQDAPPALKLPPAWKGRLKSTPVKFSIK